MYNFPVTFFRVLLSSRKTLRTIITIMQTITKTTDKKKWKTCDSADVLFFLNKVLFFVTESSSMEYTFFCKQ